MYKNPIKMGPFCRNITRQSARVIGENYSTERQVSAFFKVMSTQTSVKDSSGFDFETQKFVISWRYLFE